MLRTMASVMWRNSMKDVRDQVSERERERGRDGMGERLFVGCFTSQQHASVSQGQICSDNFMCCHTEIEVADQTF